MFVKLTFSFALLKTNVAKTSRAHEVEYYSFQKGVLVQHELESAAHYDYRDTVLRSIQLDNFVFEAKNGTHH